MIASLATIVEEPNQRSTVIVGTETETFDVSRGGDVDTQQVVELGRKLHNPGSHQSTWLRAKRSGVTASASDLTTCAEERSWLDEHWR